MSENGSACSWIWTTTHSGFYESLCINIEGIRASSAMPGRAVVLRIEPPVASRPFGFHH
ncbi:hypothetical protein [Rugosibacter aromaticivorans]|uniref:hypothetical protein n=1 Tax=Rugosibacter aromaticivorans TaxID=1565605 RepID=UPI00192A23BF|nr:hypothetical protein [Rugosibacter aromaticivorans]